MNYLPFALLAYFLNSIAVLIDKFLLNKHIPDPLVYVFYFSLFSLIALLILPFTNIPELRVFLLASSSTLLWTSGAYFMFKALKIGQASRVIPVIGSLVPISLLGYYGIATQTISTNEAWAALILITGLVMLVLPYLEGRFLTKELIYEVISAALFALSYIILKEAYSQESFLTVFAWSRIILIPVGITILLFPNLRRIVFIPQGPRLNIFSRVGALFLFGQACGGSAELLLTFSISLASPALVNSLQGSQYAFLFLFSLILARRYPKIFAEHLPLIFNLGKIFGLILLALGLYMLAVSQYKNPPQIGATYSPRYAQSLGLDPQTTFIKTLDDLKLKQVRLPVYWDEVEAVPNQFDFSRMDFYLNEAQKRDTNIILVVGFKQPRWPECFFPDWAKELPQPELNQRILSLVSKEVEYFQKYPVIQAWQIENEPLHYFGICPKPDQNTLALLKEEISLVKSKDSRPVLITDSGELSTWLNTINLGDWFGTTLYRTAWNPYIGLVDYPMPPITYQLKDSFIRLIQSANPFPAKSKSALTLIAELQTEPWANGEKSIIHMPVDEQIKSFPPAKLRANVEFAQETALSPIYLWGVEWWYWMAKQGHPEYIETAKKLF